MIKTKVRGRLTLVCAFATSALIGTVTFPESSSAQGYPTKPITMLVPFAAGGPTDVIGRQVADHMSRTLGQQVVIETATGAGGTVAAERLARAQPDGYTILIHHNGLPSAPALYSGLRYDTRTAFEPIGLVNSGPMVVVAKKATEAKTLKELFETWAAGSEKITLGHAGIGSTSWMCGLQITNVLAKKLTFVTYRGTAPSLNDVVAGQIDGMCDLAVTALAQIQAGTVKAYGATSAARLAQIGDVPTTREAGYPKLDMVVWNGLYAPKGTPKEVVAALNAALRKALDDGEIVGKLTAVANAPFAPEMRTPEAHLKYFLEQIDAQAAVFRNAGITPGKAE